MAVSHQADEIWPLLVDTDAVLAFAITLQGFELIGRAAARIRHDRLVVTMPSTLSTRAGCPRPTCQARRQDPVATGGGGSLRRAGDQHGEFLNGVGVLRPGNQTHAVNGADG